MKKLIFISLLAIVGATQAQVTFKPGFQAGLNISKFNGIDISSKKDFFAGVFGEIRFSKKYALQPEVNYSRQGAKGIYSYSPTYFSPRIIITQNTDISLEYLSIVINNKITLHKNLYLMLGEFNDVIIGDQIKQENSRSISKGQDIDYGVFGGIGYSFQKVFAIEARFKKGFADALDDYTGYKSKITNQLFQFGVSYTFDIKK